MRRACSHNDTRMLLKPDSEFFRFFADPSGKHAAAATPRLPRRRRLRRDQRPRRPGAHGGMTDFLVALGLVLAIEGLLFAAFPGAAKRAMESVAETPDQSLRMIGIVSAVVGVIADLG